MYTNKLFESTLYTESAVRSRVLTIMSYYHRVAHVGTYKTREMTQR